MPRVRVLLPTNLDGRTRLIGETVDLPAEVASYLREQGRVEIVRGERPDTPEGTSSMERSARRRVRERTVETR